MRSFCVSPPFDLGRQLKEGELGEKLDNADYFEMEDGEEGRNKDGGTVVYCYFGQAGYMCGGGCVGGGGASRVVSY